MGDLAATVSLLFVSNQWLLTAETAAVKLVVIIVSGVLGGAAGLLGKHLMQKFIDRYFQLILGICLMAVMQQGCAPRVAGVTTNAATESTDSTSVQVIERFVPVQMPGDTIWFEHWVECPELKEGKAPARPKPFKANVKGKRSDGVIELDDVGRLKAIFNCKEWRDSVKVRDTEIARLKKAFKKVTTTETILVPFVPKMYKASMWFSCIVIALLVLWAGWKVAKIYFKIQIPFLK